MPQLLRYPTDDFDVAKGEITGLAGPIVHEFGTAAFVAELPDNIGAA